MKKSLLNYLAASMILAVSALAGPNFSGSWKLNTAKSDFGMMPPPSSMTQTIKHEDPNLEVASKQVRDEGEFEATSKYTTDGKESTNEMRGMQMKSTAKWDGDALVMNTKGKFGDNDVTIDSKWTLSADGKTLTVSQHFASSMGEMDMKLVFDKQ